jgi:hypothetical protein
MTTVSVSEMLARATSRVEVRPGDARTGSVFERVVVDGERYFLKRLSPRSDWIMRVTNDHVHRPFLVWRRGVMAGVPGCIDHTVVAMEVDGEGDDAELSMLMRDVGEHLVPEGDEVVPMRVHAGFVEAMAALAAAYWGWRDGDGDLCSMEERLRFFAPDNIAAELRAGDIPGPIAAANAGWPMLVDRAPRLMEIARAVHARPALLSGPLARTPVTFLQGDWKMGNLGMHPDGRTILLDWAYPGSGPACWDLCWYVALNRARLPESKEDTIERFRSALEAHGVDTAPWWQAQIDLCLVAIMVTFGWEKALGDAGELRWWDEAVAHALRRQEVAGLV